MSVTKLVCALIGALSAMAVPAAFAQSLPDLGGRDVVVVTFNYRLGAFGFLDPVGLGADPDCGAATNLGLRDQLAANGLEAKVFSPITVRHEEGRPVPGHLVIAVRN